MVNLVFLLWGVLGCIEPGLNVVEEGDVPKFVVVSETFLQRPIPALDLLFVVDDTTSMKNPQEALAEEFLLLSQSLDTLDVRWQAGVTRMNRSYDKAGWLVGDPWLVSSSMVSAAEQLALNLQVGTDGLAAEAGLAAAMLALDMSEKKGVNASFRRPEASLMVIFVSNNDDQSDPWFTGAPVEEFMRRLDEEVSTYGVPAAVSAVVGDGPDGCNSLNGWVPPGHRYIQAQVDTGGGFASICSVDFSGFWDELVLGGDWYSAAFQLTFTPVSSQSIIVSVNGAPLTNGWTVKTGPPRLLFDEAPVPNATIVIEYAVVNKE